MYTACAQTTATAPQAHVEITPKKVYAPISASIRFDGIAYLNAAEAPDKLLQWTVHGDPTFVSGTPTSSRTPFMYNVQDVSVDSLRVTARMVGNSDAVSEAEVSIVPAVKLEVASIAIEFIEGEGLLPIEGDPFKARARRGSNVRIKATVKWMQNGKKTSEPETGDDFSALLNPQLVVWELVDAEKKGRDTFCDPAVKMILMPETMQRLP